MSFPNESTTRVLTEPLLDTSKPIIYAGAYHAPMRTGSMLLGVVDTPSSFLHPKKIMGTIKKRILE